eukprot:CAMPEP_0114364826 /NCGR_PEP_ID=MMETSP0101-20121206/27834_1 /TAXON_ID=38822 ORGANISM="Pteridomonas danica, Strain PT" /NCGR_SAMPLE_ID=MMETSP0101 /ASSEMBLY_ACC=CAM_ASM_000211 /LENGTH=384 /DNA_ID=CAMNT_0001512615 /DNA_START=340 /DNA_END=1491 /DNA_ORIENTATION=+
MPVVLVVMRIDKTQKNKTQSKQVEAQESQDIDDDGSISSLSTSDNFIVGDQVTWKGSDEDIPAGTVGMIDKIHDDGDIEVIFGEGNNAKLYTFLSSRLSHWSPGDKSFDQQNLPPVPVAKTIRVSEPIAPPPRSPISMTKKTKSTEDPVVNEEEEVVSSSAPKGGWVNGRWVSGAAYAKAIEEASNKKMNLFSNGIGDNGGGLGESGGAGGETLKEDGDKKWVVDRRESAKTGSIVVTQETQNNMAPLFKLDDLFGAGSAFISGTPDKDHVKNKKRIEVPNTNNELDHFATTVLVLLNLFPPDAVEKDSEYKDILSDVTEECLEFGDVEEVFIPRLCDGDLHGLGKVFIEFNSETSAAQAAIGLRGRLFDDRVISCAFLSESDW